MAQKTSMVGTKYASAEDRMMRDKDYFRKRCAYVNAGARCENWGFYDDKSNLYHCMKHGGLPVCNAKGCRKYVDGKGVFCVAHKGQCAFDGCNALKRSKAGFCPTHAPLAKYEWIQRLLRVAGLRDKWLDVLLVEQGGRCAQSFLACEVLDNGAATSVCPLGQRPVHRDAAQLDHITPLCEGGTNEKANLQVLCAYCHAIKSAFEARARSKRKAEGEAVCMPCEGPSQPPMAPL